MKPATHLSLPGITVTKTGLEGDIPPPDAYTALKRFRNVTTATRWIIGDLAWAAIDHDPKRVPELLQNIAEWDIDDRPALMASLLVAHRFPVETRHENLSWSHHKEVAKFDDTDAHYWLGRADHEKWSVHRMRETIRETRALTAPEQTEAIPKPWHTEHRAAVREISELFARQPDATVLLSSDGTWKTV